MKNNVITIMKKEFARFFRDRRMVITTILLPGLLIYFIYSFMGSAIGGMFSVSEDYRPGAYVENLPASMEPLFDSAGLDVTASDSGDEALELVKEKELDLFISFPEGFDEAVSAYDSASGAAAPAVEVYYNSTSTESLTAYQTVTAMLDGYESSLANKFDVNAGGGAFDLASEKDSSSQFFAMMLPMLMMIFMFSGCMAVAPESIAGEKERGTIATLLITPMKRSQLAIGKIISLGAIALLSGLSSFVGTALSLPKLMGGVQDGVSAAVYSPVDYLLLVLTILSTVLLLVALISMISAFAKTIKEATTAVMPLMILTMLIGVSAMFGDPQTNPVYYCIPLYNSVQCMSSIFSFSVSAVNTAITVGVNLILTGVCVVVLTKMFNSERVMFSK